MRRLFTGLHLVAECRKREEVVRRGGIVPANLLSARYHEFAPVIISPIQERIIRLGFGGFATGLGLWSITRQEFLHPRQQYLDPILDLQLAGRAQKVLKVVAAQRRSNGTDDPIHYPQGSDAAVLLRRIPNTF